MTKWRWEDLIDLEVQISKDDSGNAGKEASKLRNAVLAQEIAKKLDVTPESLSVKSGEVEKTSNILWHWVQTLRDRGEEMVGTQVWRSFLWLKNSSKLLMFFIGASWMSICLSYNGEEPINLLPLFAIMLLLPGILMLLSAVSLSFSGLFSNLKGGVLNIGLWLYSLVGESLHMLLGKMVSKAAKEDSWSRTFVMKWLRRKGGVESYGDLKKWTIIEWVQQLGVFLVTGQLVALLCIATMSDLAFRWGSTVDFSSEQLLTFCNWVSWPWAFLWPEAQPELSWVENSRYIRLEGVYVLADEGRRSVENSEMGKWWAFLAMSTLCWNFLPRLLFWVVAKLKLTSSWNSVRLDHGDHLAVCESLFPKTKVAFVESPVAPESKITFERPISEVSNQSINDGVKNLSGDKSVEVKEIAVIYWLGLKLDLSEEIPGEKIFEASAGVSLDITEDEKCIRDCCQTDMGVDVFLCVETSEPPIEDCFLFIKSLSAALGANRNFEVILKDVPSQNMLEFWEEALQQRQVNYRVLKDGHD